MVILALMTVLKPAGSPDNTPTFPYSIVWEEFGGEWESLEGLRQNAGRLRAFVDAANLSPQADVSVATNTDIEHLIAECGLETCERERLGEHSLLIAWRYQTAIYRKAWAIDLQSVRLQLKTIAHISRQLDIALSCIPTEVVAVMHLMQQAEPDVDQTSAPFPIALMRSVVDLAVIAQRIFNETAPTRTGRREAFLRDSTIKLAIEAASDAGLNDLVVSREPEPHLNGRAGRYIRDLFGVIERHLTDSQLATAVDRVRRKMKRRANAANAPHLALGSSCA